ncbi:MAG: hypothetical protein R3A44_38350 [Caldilineaceae bacterium]
MMATHGQPRRQPQDADGNTRAHELDARGTEIAAAERGGAGLLMKVKRDGSVL